METLKVGIAFHPLTMIVWNQRRYHVYAPSGHSVAYCTVHIRENYFNEILKISNSLKFRLTEYKRYTVYYKYKHECSFVAMLLGGCITSTCAANCVTIDREIFDGKIFQHGLIFVLFSFCRCDPLMKRTRVKYI